MNMKMNNQAMQTDFQALLKQNMMADGMQPGDWQQCMVSTADMATGKIDVNEIGDSFGWQALSAMGLNSSAALCYLVRDACIDDPELAGQTMRKIANAEVDNVKDANDGQGIDAFAKMKAENEEFFEKQQEDQQRWEQQQDANQKFFDDKKAMEERMMAEKQAQEQTAQNQPDANQANMSIAALPLLMGGALFGVHEMGKMTTVAGQMADFNGTAGSPMMVASNNGGMLTNAMQNTIAGMSNPQNTLVNGPNDLAPIGPAPTPGTAPSLAGNQPGMDTTIPGMSGPSPTLG